MIRISTVFWEIIFVLLSTCCQLQLQEVRFEESVLLYGFIRQFNSGHPCCRAQAYSGRRDFGGTLGGYKSDVGVAPTGRSNS